MLTSAKNIGSYLLSFLPQAVQKLTPGFLSSIEADAGPIINLPKNHYADFDHPLETLSVFCSMKLEDLDQARFETWCQEAVKKLTESDLDILFEQYATADDEIRLSVGYRSFLHYLFLNNSIRSLVSGKINDTSFIRDKILVLFPPLIEFYNKKDMNFFIFLEKMLAVKDELSDQIIEALGNEENPLRIIFWPEGKGSPEYLPSNLFSDPNVKSYLKLHPEKIKKLAERPIPKPVLNNPKLIPIYLEEFLDTENYQKIGGFLLHKLADTFVWNNDADIKKNKQQLEKSFQCSEHEYFYDNVFKPLKNEIERVRLLPGATQNIDKPRDQEIIVQQKLLQLETAEDELLSEYFKNIGDDKDQVSIKRQLAPILEKYERSKELGQYRNRVAGFFKSIVGGLFVMATVGTLKKSTYACFFWQSTSVTCLKRISANLRV